MPRAAEEFFQSMDSRSISSGWGGEDRVRRWCKWPGRSYLQCLWPLRWSLGYHRIGHGTRRVVGTSPQLTGGGRTRARGCSCHLRARCRCHRRCGHSGRGRGLSSRLMSPSALGLAKRQKVAQNAVFSCFIYLGFWRYTLALMSAERRLGCRLEGWSKFRRMYTFG